MSTFDETQHPRGQATNAGQFQAKSNDGPASRLGDRATRLAEAGDLTREVIAIRRNRSLSDEDKGRVAELEARIAALTARPGRKSRAIERVALTPMNRTAMAFIPFEGQDDKLDLNPPYQRGSVWTGAQHRSLIESILRGVPIGAVTINDRWSTNGYSGDTGYAVIDGKQRIETIRGFFADEFSVPADWFEDDEIADEDADGEIRFSQLTIRGQRRAENWPVPTIQSSIASVEGEAHLYGLLNSGGTAQTDADIRNARDVASGRDS